jgi:hypothetical protein
LKVLKNSGEASYKLLFAISKGVRYFADDPLPEIAYEVFPDAEWDQPFSNGPEIEIVPHRADAFKSIRMDKTSYNIGDTAKITVELENANGEANWIIDGGTNSEALSKKFKVSIGDRENGIIPMDWARDGNNQPIENKLEGTFAVTEEMYHSRPDGKLRAKTIIIAMIIATARTSPRSACWRISSFISRLNLPIILSRMN